jgi:hypothetical protein
MDMSNITDVNTSVEKLDLDIDSWLGAPGADSVLSPSETENAKPNIFDSLKTDISFLDSDNNSDSENKVKPEEMQHINNMLDEDIKSVENEEEEIVPAKGRPKAEKSALVGFLKKRIEANEMFAFDDYNEEKETLDDYLGSLTEKDVDDLWQANISNIKHEVASSTPAEFFESLPEELQYAAKYVADGGQDLKGLFKALSHVEQIRELDPTDEVDQENIVKSYLQATNFGDTDEIEEELTNWKDLGQLEKKAKQFKPKLDLMQEEIIQSRLAEQEMFKQQQEQAATVYVQNVFDTLRNGELNGVKLDKKVQSFLYNGLTNPQYPSLNGSPTNLLGHLLEKYQYVEPRYDLISEALWLLSNPDDYKANLIRQGKNQAVEQTVRQLKTEQSRNKASSSVNINQTEQTKKIQRNANIFKR